MNYSMSVTNLMNFFVPITRFNRGEASKIFDEVRKNGVKIVLKNDVPACVLVEPTKYDEMVRLLEDYELFFEAEKRMKNAETKGFLSHEDVMKRFGITEEELDDIDVEIE